METEREALMINKTQKEVGVWEEKGGRALSFGRN